MVLSPRLGAGTQATLELTTTQRTVRDRVLERLNNGTYQLAPMPCFCGDTGGLVVAERDRYGLPVRTVLCSNCGLMRTDPYMTPETTRRFYEEDYRDLYSQQGPEHLFEAQQNEGRLLGERLLKIPGIETVYDIGCGAGGFLMPFAQSGCDVAGCDYGEAYLELGRAHGLDLIQGGVEALLEHRGGQQADLVTLLQVAEHFVDLRGELSAVIEAIKPGGLLLLTVPGLMNVHQGAYRGDLLRYLQNAHTFHFCAATLTWVLNTLGLEVHSADEFVLLLAQRPSAPESDQPLIPPDPNTVRQVVRYIGQLERTQLQAQVSA
ncbi:MAG: class I SAM-dependent methyltransferase [Myxococcota bacterium]